MGTDPKRDPHFAHLNLTELAGFLPLFVSILFAIHIQGLWPNLFDRLEANRKPELVPQFKLVELFLNTWAEEDLRFRTVTRELVTEVMQSVRKRGAVNLGLDLDEPWALYALRLAPRPRKHRLGGKPRKSFRSLLRRTVPRAAGRLTRRNRKPVKGVPKELELV